MRLKYELPYFIGSWSRYAQIPGQDVQGYLAHKKTPPPLGLPKGHRHSLLEAPRGMRILMSEVPLYPEAF